MLKFIKTNQNNQIINQLVSDNCLSFGRSPELTNRKITHYISGTRQKVDIFNLYEMRYLLLKVYPLIHNLFLQQRLNVKKKKPIFLNKSSDFKTTSQKLPNQLKNWKDFWNFHSKSKITLRGAKRPLLPKILFATTTELYSSIVSSAARKCHMPFHVNRWLSGTITASSAYIDDFEQWSFLTNKFHKNINVKIHEKFHKRKKNFSEQAKKIRKYQLGRKPSLIIIPDASNNEMIIKETKNFGIPVLGLVSSNCNTEIAYPIFANDSSIYSIHFFCHFLSSLITKEIVKNKQKLYSAKKRTLNIQFPQAIKDIFRFNLHVSKLKLSKKRRKKKEYSFQGRYFLDSFVIPKVKIKKKIKYEKKKQLQTFKISAKKLIWIENQKRLGQSFYLANRIRTKVQLLKRLHKFNFPKVIRQIRLPVNKPKFRSWNQNKFFYANSLKSTHNTQRTFQLKRFIFPRILRKMLKGIKKGNRLRKWNNNLRFSKKDDLKQKKATPFRKRWPSTGLKGLTKKSKHYNYVNKK